MDLVNLIFPHIPTRTQALPVCISDEQGFSCRLIQEERFLMGSELLKLHMILLRSLMTLEAIWLEFLKWSAIGIPSEGWNAEV